LQFHKKNIYMKIQNFAIALICVLPVSCAKWGNSDNKRLMQQAEYLMEHQPDSALMLLDAISITNLGVAENAEYLLLLIQAKDKAGKDITADTVIFAVRDFFVKEKNDEKAALSCYYAGRVLEEQGNAKAAMQAYLEAETMARTLKNHEKLKGLIETHTGNLYYGRIETNEAINHYRKAADYFKRAEDNVNEMFSINAIGCSHLINESFDSALYYLNKVTEIPAYQNNQKMQRSIIRNLGIIAQYEDNHQKARDMYLQALRQNTGEQVEAVLYICLSQAYQGLQLQDSATYYIERATKLCEKMKDQPLASIYKTWMKIEESNGNYGQALQYAQKQMEYMLKEYEKFLDRQLSEAERKYRYEAERNKNSQLTIQKKNDLIIFLILLAVILVAAILLLVFNARLKKMIVKKDKTIHTLTGEIDERRSHTQFLEKEIARNMELIQQLKDEKTGEKNEKNKEIDAKIETREEQAGQLVEQLRLTYSYMLKAHLDICKKYESFKRGLKMEEHGNTIQLTDKFLYGKEGKINWETILPLLPVNFEEKIKKRYVKLNTSEIRLCCLLLFDLDIYNLLRILPYNKNSLQATKSKIRKKIGSNDIIKALTPLIH